ncbi:unnamed protein product [Lactuca saligna]|uniref:Uncharacterized protein n=1 Tax=Lactuca saligna TaxID=75948 RepID=A0AA35YYS9_LACSI|nr:unnamed protein product [Lactuca saligna]
MLSLHSSWTGVVWSHQGGLVQALRRIGRCNGCTTPLDNCTPETSLFIFQTPPVGRQPRAQQACSERITRSIAIIADLQEYLEARDAELQRHNRDMQRMLPTMRVAGLLSLKDEEVENEEPCEVISDSRLVTQ